MIYCVKRAGSVSGEQLTPMHIKRSVERIFLLFWPHLLTPLSRKVCFQLGPGMYAVGSLYPCLSLWGLTLRSQAGRGKRGGGWVTVSSWSNVLWCDCYLQAFSVIPKSTQARLPGQIAMVARWGLTLKGFWMGSQLSGILSPPHRIVLWWMTKLLIITGYPRKVSSLWCTFCGSLLRSGLLRAGPGPGSDGAPAQPPSIARA